MSYIYMEHPFLMFLDHTQRRTTVGRTPLDEWPARLRDLYLTTHDTHNRQISMTLVGFEPKISAGKRPQAARLLRSWVRVPPEAWIFVCCECRALSGRGLWDELVTRPEESYRMCCVVVCDLETSRMSAPYIYDISRLRVNIYNQFVSGTVIILSTITSHYYCHTIPLNSVTQVSANKCLGTQFFGLAFRPPPRSRINSCPLDVCRKL